MYNFASKWVFTATYIPSKRGSIFDNLATTDKADVLFLLIIIINKKL